MKSTTAVVVLTLAVGLVACSKTNNATVNEEVTPAAAPAPAMAPESAATTPAMADTTGGQMKMGADTGMAK